MKRAIEVKLEPGLELPPAQLAKVKPESGVKLEPGIPVVTGAAKRLKTSQTDIPKTGTPVIYQVSSSATSIQMAATRVLASTRIVLHPDRPIVDQLFSIVRIHVQLRIGFEGPPTVTAMRTPPHLPFEVNGSMKGSDLTSSVACFYIQDYEARLIECKLTLATTEVEELPGNPIPLVVSLGLTQMDLLRSFMERVMRPIIQESDPNLSATVRVGLLVKPPSETDTCETVNALEVHDRRRAFGYFPLRLRVTTRQGTFESYILGHHAFKGMDIIAQVLEEPLGDGFRWHSDIEAELAGIPLGRDTLLHGVPLKLGQGVALKSMNHFATWIFCNSTYHLVLTRKPFTPQLFGEWRKRFCVHSIDQWPVLTVCNEHLTFGPKINEQYICLPPDSRAFLLYNGIHHVMFFEDQPGAHRFIPHLYKDQYHPTTHAQVMARVNYTADAAWTVDLSGVSPVQWWEAGY